MDKNNPSGNLAGTVVLDPEKHGERLLFKPLRSLIIIALCAIFNFKLKFKFTDAAGNVIAIQDSDVQISKIGMTVTTPPLQISPQNGQGGGSSSQTPFHPFKIYQPTDFAAFTQGITFLGNDGMPTVCTIDATKPTDFTAMPPTVNPTTDAWRFWAIRTGYIEYRPQYFFSMRSASSGDNNAAGYAPENWVFKYMVETGTDGIWPIYGKAFDDPITVPFFNSFLIMAGDVPDGGFYTKFALWIDITPDTNASFPIIQIKARRVTSHSNAENGFPYSTPNIIPIGIAQYNLSKTDTLVWQYVFDHVRGRYPVPNSAFVVGFGKTFCSGSVMNFRGYYDDPSEFADQAFYAGDILILGNSQIFQFLGQGNDNKPGPGSNFGEAGWTLIFGS